MSLAFAHAPMLRRAWAPDVRTHHADALRVLTSIHTAASLRQSQSGDAQQAQQRLLEWPLSAAAPRAPGTALPSLPGLLEAIDRLDACAGQASLMRQLLSCQDVCFAAALLDCSCPVSATGGSSSLFKCTLTPHSATNVHTSTGWCEWT